MGLNYNLGRRVGGSGFPSETARVVGRLGLYHGRVDLGFDVSYDLEQSLMQSAVYEVNYRNQCSGVRIYYAKRRWGTDSDREIQFSIGLRNLGQFIKYRSKD